MLTLSPESIEEQTVIYFLFSISLVGATQYVRWYLMQYKTEVLVSLDVIKFSFIIISLAS